MKKHTRSKFKILKEFNSKARCIYTQYRANQLWDELVKFLTDRQKHYIYVAWNHFEFCREGPGELDYLCKMLKNDWLGKEKWNY